MPMQRTLFTLALLMAGASGATVVLADTAVIDPGLGTGLYTVQTDPGQPDNVTLSIMGGALLNVSSTGTRTILSDFGNPAQGALGSGALTGVSWAPSGLLGASQVWLVTDAAAGTNAGALFTVDPSTGHRTLFSDFGNAAQGPVGKTPAGVVYAHGLLGLDSAIYVLDNLAGTQEQGALFEIDPLTGNRTLLSDFGNGAQGALGKNPMSLAVVPAGILTGILGNNAGFVVLDDDVGTDGVGAVLVVDHLGHRTLLSDLGNSSQGLLAQSPQAIATAPTGLLGLGTAIYVTDNEIGTGGNGGVYQIQSNGQRTQVSDFGNLSQGSTGIDPNGIAATTDGSGNLWVADDLDAQSPTQAQLFVVNPVTGNRTSGSNCTLISLGPCQAPSLVSQH